jgi:hypothetical protein
VANKIQQRNQLEKELNEERRDTVAIINDMKTKQALLSKQVEQEVRAVQCVHRSTVQHTSSHKLLFLCCLSNQVEKEACSTALLTTLFLRVIFAR